HLWGLGSQWDPFHGIDPATSLTRCSIKTLKPVLVNPTPALAVREVSWWLFWCLSWFCSYHDRHSNAISPLSPRTIIIAYRFVTKKITQHKPGVCRTLTDAAISDYVI